jgi:hypothetical protein
MVAVVVAVLVLLTMMRSFAADAVTLLYCYMRFVAVADACWT